MAAVCGVVSGVRSVSTCTCTRPSAVVNMWVGGTNRLGGTLRRDGCEDNVDFSVMVLAIRGRGDSIFVTIESAVMANKTAKLSNWVHGSRKVWNGT